jgi:hypothetical protein
VRELRALGVAVVLGARGRLGELRPRRRGLVLALVADGEVE